MENPFKKIIHHHSVPKVLKEKILNDISVIKLTLDIADLFMVKYPNVISSFLKKNKENQ